MQIIKKYFSEIEKCVNDFNITLESLQTSSSNELLYTQAIGEYKILFLKLLLSEFEDDVKKNTKTLVFYTIENDISYLFLYSELITVVRNFLGNLLEKHDFEYINEINHFFTEHENRVTVLYLQRFLKQLKLKNELRLSHIAIMPDKKFMIYYESHIRWILNLILYIEDNKFDDNYPQLDPSLCDFGKWLHGATTSYLITTAHFKIVEKLHINLHDLAANVVKHCKSNSIHPSTLIHLMQKIDYYSLEIGNEIAFLNGIEESAKDPLTHLLTRRLFNKIMINKLDIAKATGREFAMIMCDLDHFKYINDNYGHALGDIILQHFSSILEHTLRKSDYIFRFGGEEFIVLLSMTNKEEAYILAQKVCDATAASEVMIGEKTIKYTVSIGTISIVVDNKTAINQEAIDRYVSNVDEKLYLAKEKGRNRVE